MSVCSIRSATPHRPLDSLLMLWCLRLRWHAFSQAATTMHHGQAASLIIAKATEHCV